MLSDMDLLIHLCESVDPESIFMITPPVFSQNLLLKLITLLSKDLGDSTIIKTRYVNRFI